MACPGPAATLALFDTDDVTGIGPNRIVEFVAWSGVVDEPLTRLAGTFELDAATPAGDDEEFGPEVAGPAAVGVVIISTQPSILPTTVKTGVHRRSLRAREDCRGAGADGRAAGADCRHCVIRDPASLVPLLGNDRVGRWNR